MIREFDPSCNGCANNRLLCHFADQAEVLEQAVKKGHNLRLDEVGRVGCRRVELTPLNRGDSLEDSSRTCMADGPVAPVISRTELSVAGLSVSTQLAVEGVPELMGKPLQGGGLLVTAADMQQIEGRLHQVGY